MKIPNFLLLCDGMDGGGGGGAADAGGSADAGGAGGGNNAPSAYDLDDDTPIRIKGQKEPVKFGDWYKGLRGSQTKEAQARAEAERKLGEATASQKTLKQQYDQLLAAVNKARQTGDKTDALASIRQLQYLNGEQAAQIVEAVQNRINQTDQGFQTRDQAIVFLGRKLAEVMKQVQGFQGRTNQQDFDSKIGRFVKDSGYGEEYTDLAKEIYLAYEGNDLDEEFPAIFKGRVQQIERAMKAAEAKRVAARKQNMFVPGAEKPRSPSEALRDKRLARGKPKDIAGAIWDNMVGGGSDT